MRHAPVLDYAAMTDAELADLARGGDHGAFRMIMQRCNQRLFRVARAIVRDDAEAEDVLQEAYVRAFAAIDGFRGDAAIATWLTRIVLNEAHGRLRRRRPTAELAALDAEPVGRILPFPGREPADPEAEAARAQIRRLVEQAVDDLPEAFRLVFVLREIEGLDVEETAAELGLRPETVKTRLHRARRRLRGALEAKLADTATGLFPFLGLRCQRVTEAVLQRLGQGGRA